LREEWMKAGPFGTVAAEKVSCEKEESFFCRRTIPVGKGDNGEGTKTKKYEGGGHLSCREGLVGKKSAHLLARPSSFKKSQQKKKGKKQIYAAQKQGGCHKEKKNLRP